jgi:hypothetical protein
MTATVLPFRGKWEGPAAYQPPKQAIALHDARCLMAAKAKNDDWTARLLLLIVETLTDEQRWMLEFRLLGDFNEQEGRSEATAQALAIVQLATGGKEHRERVREALALLAEREA